MNLITERLLLVPVSQRHTQEIFEHFNKKIITYMSPAVADNISETHRVVRGFIEQRKNNTDYVYAIALKTSGEFVGLVGLHHLKDKIPELGIWIKLEAHGNHYGREAIGAVINVAKTLGLKKLCYPVDRKNTPSKKIAFFYGGELAGNGKTVETQDGRVLELETYQIQV